MRHPLSRLRHPVLAASGGGPSVCPDLRGQVWSRRPQPPEGGRRQWPGQARSTASAGLACSAAVRLFAVHGRRVVRNAMGN